MTVNTEIGQLHVRCDGHDYIFSPSLLAMTRIGSPEYIIDCFVKVFGGHYPQNVPDNPWIQKVISSPVYGRPMLSAALIIMQACCDDDITPLAGEFRFNAAGRQIYRPGRMDVKNIIILAQHLIHHGVTGDNAIPATEDSGGYSSQFDARTLVYSLVAHMGITEERAWEMSMTAINYLLRARFPELNKPKLPSQDDYDAAWEWADKIMAMDT